MIRSRLRPFPLLTLLACLCYLLAAAPVRVFADAPAPGTTVPITLRAEHIWIDGTLNGKPAHFILDTGAGGILVTPDAAVRCGIIEDARRAVVHGASNIDAGRAVVPTMGVGDALLHEQQAFIVALPEQLAGCDGLLGYPFLAHFLVTVDYAAKTCTIGHEPPASAHPWFPLHFEQNVPTIDGRVDGRELVRFEIDSGSGAAAMLWSPYVKKEALAGRYSPRISTVTGRGIGGLTYGDMVRIPTLTLGNGSKPDESLTLHGVVTELSRQTEGGFYSKKSAGQIGADILDRFTVTFDYAHSRIQLVPNANFGKPFVYDRVGMRIDEQDGKFVVVDVTPDSPAAKAGVSKDDEILSVDGVAASTLTAVGLYDKLRQPVGTPMRFQRRRAGQSAADSQETTVVLRDLL